MWVDDGQCGLQCMFRCLMYWQIQVQSTLFDHCGEKPLSTLCSPLYMLIKIYKFFKNCIQYHFFFTRGLVLSCHCNVLRYTLTFSKCLLVLNNNQVLAYPKTFIGIIHSSIAYIIVYASSQHDLNSNIFF